ncbi:hypothetical protein MtrunA17_Chr2g0303331 [Medicago truncatula]|uniref:Dentin sialophosphoprotein-like protein, putative n=1 Tax=Medicago truncatula TaxID=3880 RepID=A0A072V6W3_MEDTR|nr:uncharacterized protein LOC25486693 [Medicago truncatula]KEH37804.1 dentin sialophosphoprotein-like protein, putative [Medicago truncatula]RHN73879.1 hypothetical protein MtrunA17_Chr2g0303331 [Medicago truncatula]
MEEVEKRYISTVVGETVDESVEYGGQIVEHLSGEAEIENAAAVKLDRVVSEREARYQSIVGTDSCAMDAAAEAAGHPSTSLFADILETIDSILNMPFVNDGKVDRNSSIVDIEETSNFGNDKFDANSNIVVDIMETIDSILNMPIGNDKVDGKTNIVHEVVCGTEVEKCNATEQVIADKDVSGVSALNAEQSDVYEGMEIYVEDQQETERSRTMNQTVEVNGLLVSIEGEENFDANAIAEEGTQITDQGSYMLLRDGKEKLSEESNMRQKVEEQECVDKDNSFFVDEEQDLCEVIEYATPVVNTDDQAGPRNLNNQSSTHQKRKSNFKDTMHSVKKEKRMLDPLNGSLDSPDGDCWTPDHLVSPEHSKKRSAFDHFDDDFKMQTGNKTISVAEVSNTTNSSYKIGDCIHRADSQLTPKTDVDVRIFPENGLDVSPTTVEYDENTTEYSSQVDMLSPLQCVAQKPLGEYTFLNGIVSFFSDFKNSVIVSADWKEISRTDELDTMTKKKLPIAGTGFMSDLHWTDWVIENGNEEKPVQQPLLKNQKKDEQLVAAKSPKPAQVNRGPSSEKNSKSNHAETPNKPHGYIDEKAPAELVMNFTEFKSVPSETNLNKMFRRFGRLNESETEVDRVSSRARVVFKKRVDAEVALGSAKKFKIFGSVLVNYQLNYTPSAFKVFRKR